MPSRTWRILVTCAALAEGIARSDLGSQLFGKHSRAEHLTRVLEVLHKSGLAEARTEKTGGRPTETWHATHRGVKGVNGAKGFDQEATAPTFTPSTPSPPSESQAETAPDPDDVEEVVL